MNFFVKCILVFALALGAVAKDLVVEDVNSDNFDRFFGKQPVLLEFYAPWCKHCQGFEGSLEVIGKELKTDGIAVGKLDITKNQAISSRFDITSIPSFFLHRDNKLWKYDGPITVDALINFSQKGFKKEQALPLWSSPIGPIGSLKGLLITIGVNIMQFVPWLSTTLGVPTWAGFVIAALGFGVCIMSATFIGIFYSVSHAKTD